MLTNYYSYQSRKGYGSNTSYGMGHTPSMTGGI
nr:MAG TPA: hypothetical protein [Caudoviricetes sp.]